MVTNSQTMTTLHDATANTLPALPAIVDGVVAHRRRGPLRHEFRHRAYQWLVDLDELPHPPWYLRQVAGFDARDHIGGNRPDASRDIKRNVERFLALRDVDLGASGRIVMLANARVFGHVFDPLTVFWCFGTDDTLRCVVAEVHNTYGERHAYLLMPGPHGEAGANKQFYVSPFNDVSGDYAMRFTLTRTGRLVGAVLRRLVGAPDTRPHIDVVAGPLFANNLCALRYEGAKAELKIEQYVPDGGEPKLADTPHVTLA